MWLQFRLIIFYKLDIVGSGRPPVIKPLTVGGICSETFFLDAYVYYDFTQTLARLSCKTWSKYVWRFSRGLH